MKKISLILLGLFLIIGSLKLGLYSLDNLYYILFIFSYIFGIISCLFTLGAIVCK